MIDEDSDDGIVFNFKSIKTHLPESGTPKRRKNKKGSKVIITLSRNPRKKSQRSVSLESCIGCQNKR
jgi:hypothetical protein